MVLSNPNLSTTNGKVWVSKSLLSLSLSSPLCADPDSVFQILSGSRGTWLMVGPKQTPWVSRDQPTLAPGISVS